jgi:hypothetical protein
MSGFIGKRGADIRTSYYRASIRKADFERVMTDAGKLSVTQLVALLWDTVPPEAKTRYFDLCNGESSLSIEQKMLAGMRRVIQLRIWNFVTEGRCKKYGSGKDCKYEWIEAKDDPAKKDSPRRGHAKPKGTRPGRN